MRRLVRLALSPEALRFLKEKRTDLVTKKRTHRTKVAKARELWALQRNKAFVEIRSKLGQMCSGIKRCMYCEDSRGVAIDHFWPLSLYPRKAFEWHNYVYGCTPCNTNKSNDFPLSKAGRPLLLDPTSADTADDPSLHLELRPGTGKLRPLTRRGRESRRVYDLDRDDLTKGRRNAWAVFQALIARYASLRAARRDVDAQRLADAIKAEEFSGVFAYLLTIAGGVAASSLDPDCVAAIGAYPEIKSWV